MPSMIADKACPWDSPAVSQRIGILCQILALSRAPNKRAANSRSKSDIRVQRSLLDDANKDKKSGDYGKSRDELSRCREG